MRLEGVFARYGRRDPWVLQDVTGEIEPGDTIVVTGRNGAGKSTLLRVLAGLLPVGRGAVRDRPDVVGWVPERFPSAQPFAVLPYLQGIARVQGIPKQTAQRAIESWGERFYLAPFFHTPLAELSKGTARKVGLIQALLRPPRLLVMDEPWEGLDAQSQAELPAVVAELTKAGGSCVLTDHRGRAADLGEVRHWQVHDGRLAEENTPAVIDAKHQVIEIVVRTDEVAATVEWLREAGYDVHGTREHR
jgi:ABC-2 type transport system ATP-binding protein